MAALKSQVELALSASKLPSMDMTSESDPFVELYVQMEGTEGEKSTSTATGATSADGSVQDPKWQKLGRTEMIKDCNNPRWRQKFVVDYWFERVQTLRFRVMDSDGPKKPAQLIGEATCSLGHLMGARGQCERLPLNDAKGKPYKDSTIVVYAENILGGEQKQGESGLSELVSSGVAVASNEEAEREEKRIINLMSNTELAKFIDQLPTEICVKPAETTGFIFTFAGKGLDKKDFFGSSDPYFKILRRREASEGFDEVKTSDKILNNINPVWDKFELSLQQLCNGDRNRELVVEVWDWDKSSAHDLIGKCSFTVAQIEAVTDRPNTFDLIEPSKAKKKDYKNSGTLIVEYNRVQSKAEYVPNPKLRLAKEVQATIPKLTKNPRVDFVQFLAGGLELDFSICIDWTASNGALHSTATEKKNPYEEAIQAVGTVIRDYDDDHQFPVYGYGGWVDQYKTVYYNVVRVLRRLEPKMFDSPHQTQANAALAAAEQQARVVALQEEAAKAEKEFRGEDGDAGDHCHDVEGVLYNYRKINAHIKQGSMSQVKKNDKQNYYADDFYPLIDLAARRFGPKSLTQDVQRYSVVLFIIDGDAFDNQATIDAIVRASFCPVSIIIVGVGGKSQFTNCKKFDADGVVLVAKDGTKAVRDAVQFVQFDSKITPTALACELLKELPQQVCDYMYQNNIVPNRKRGANI